LDAILFRSQITDHRGETDGRIAPRSGLAAKNFIDTGAGVIDADYRGEVKVLLFNFSDVDFTSMSTPNLNCIFKQIVHWLTQIQKIVKEDDRIAQLVLERVSRKQPETPPNYHALRRKSKESLLTQPATDLYP
jgi:dUTPase